MWWIVAQVHHKEQRSTKTNLSQKGRMALATIVSGAHD